MEGEREVKTQVHEFGKLEEIFEDIDGDIFDTLLSFGLVHELKNKLKTFKDQGFDLHNVYKTQFHYFCLDQTLNFPYFVACCASNYSHSKCVIMDSGRHKIIFPINSILIRESLEVPLSFTQNQEYLIEENLIKQFRYTNVEEKQVFNSKS